MSGDVHVRFCERLGGRFPGATRLVLLHEHREQLEAWREEIAGFLHERLGLRLREAGRPAAVGNCSDFMGHVIRPQYRLVRRRVVGHIQARLSAQGRAVRSGHGTVRLGAEQASLASYFGHCRHAQQEAGLTRSVFRRHPWLKHVLETPSPDNPTALRRVDRPPRVTSLASQWRYFRGRYPGHLLLLQVGNRLETWSSDLGRAPLRAGGQAVARPGLGPGLAWPIGAGRSLRRALRRRRQPYCQVCEDGWLKGGMKRWVLRWVYSPPPPAPGAMKQPFDEPLIRGRL